MIDKKKLDNILDNTCPDCGGLLDFDGEDEIYICHNCVCGWKIEAEQ